MVILDQLVVTAIGLQTQQVVVERRSPLARVAGKGRCKLPASDSTMVIAARKRRLTGFIQALLRAITARR
jgi:hypothetical protein